MTNASRPHISIQPDTKPLTWCVTTRCVLDSPLDEVFAFFSDAGNLEKLTPPWVGFEVLSQGPLDMCEGLVIDYRIRLHGIPIRWRTKITIWDPPHRFSDVQLRGPYALWDHTHAFRAIDESTTEMIDTIRYRPKGWILAPFINRLFVEKDVRRIFAYRTQQMNTMFGSAAPLVS